LKSFLGELLIKNGIITRRQLDEALDVQKKRKKRLGEILVELGYINSGDLIWMLSEQAEISFVQAKPEMMDSQLINKFPRKLLRKNSILPLYETEDKIYIASGDPTNHKTIQKIKEFTKKEVVISGADPEKIEQLLNKFFSEPENEQIIQSKFSAKTNIKIIDNHAEIEFIDESGKITRKRLRAEIVIKIGTIKEPKDDV